MQLLSLCCMYLLAQRTYGQGLQPVVKRFPGSITSSQSERLDLFFADKSGYVYHKYHANLKAGWSEGFESMNLTTGRGFGPRSATLGGTQTHLFVNEGGWLIHRFWDGTQWLPPYDEDSDVAGEVLAQGFDANTNIAVTSRGSNRLHIIAKDYDGHFGHKYYDGTTWKPDGNETFEDLGHDNFGDRYFISDPAVSSWGPDRLDIFGILDNGTLLHKYWDGYQWQPSPTGWEQWGDGFRGEPVVSSWAENRLDVWVLKADGDRVFTSLSHRYWDGTTLSEWEDHGGAFYITPSVTSWAVNRIDLYGAILFAGFHRYWNGSYWLPDIKDDETRGWDYHGPEGSSLSTGFVSASWGENDLSVFAVGRDESIRWQHFNGSGWAPTNNTYQNLGVPELPDIARGRSSRLGSKKHGNENEVLLVQDNESIDL